MKINKFSLTILFFTILSCNSFTQNNDILLKGSLGQFDGEIVLEKEGDFFNGIFKYTSLNKEEIKLKGQKESNSLRLSEFNANNEITGFFKGEYNNNKYVGEWSDPSEKIKVPFRFNLEEINDQLLVERIGLSNNNESFSNENLKKAYLQWYKLKTGSDREFLTDEECSNEMNGDMFNYESAPSMRYGTVLYYDEAPQFITGHLNDDKFLDAVLGFESYFCGGTGYWTISLVFISNESGEYEVYYNPDLQFDTDENVGFEYFESIENKTIIGKHRVPVGAVRHPNYEREFRISYENGKFKTQYGELKEME